MKKAWMFLALVLLVTGCAGKRVIVKKESCAPQPGMQGADNCELIREM